MDRAEVADKVKKVVSQVFNVPVDSLKEETCFVDDLHAKSMSIIELLAALEMEFGFRIPQRDVRENKTVGQAIEYMYEKAKKIQ
jgi:acyl carrier protein